METIETIQEQQISKTQKERPMDSFFELNKLGKKKKQIEQRIMVLNGEFKTVQSEIYRILKKELGLNFDSGLKLDKKESVLTKAAAMKSKLIDILKENPEGAPIAVIAPKLEQSYQTVYSYLNRSPNTFVSDKINGIIVWKLNDNISQGQ